MFGRLLYSFCVITLKILFRFFYKMEVHYHGIEKLPKGGGLIVSNHVSFLDPTIIGSGLEEHIHYVARSTLFRSWFGSLIRQVGAIPIKRGGINPETFRAIQQVVANEKKILLFPEGTRSKDGKLQDIKPGVLLIIERVKCPIYPVYIRGSYDIWNSSRRMPKLSGKIVVVYGPPINPEVFKGLPKKEARTLLQAKLKESLSELELQAAHY